MRKSVVMIICSLVVGILPFQSLFAMERFGWTDEVLTNIQTDVVWDKITQSTDPFRDGTELIAEGIGDDTSTSQKIYYSEVTSTTQSRTKTADFVKALVNYALAIVGLVALLYVVYHGFLTLTAAGKDDQFSKWLEGMKYGAFALAGIGVARFVLSLVFWLIQQIT